MRLERYFQSFLIASSSVMSFGVWRSSSPGFTPFSLFLLLQVPSDRAVVVFPLAGFPKTFSLFLLLLIGVYLAYSEMEREMTAFSLFLLLLSLDTTILLSLHTTWFNFQSFLIASVHLWEGIIDGMCRHLHLSFSLFLLLHNKYTVYMLVRNAKGEVVFQSFLIASS